MFVFFLLFIFIAIVKYWYAEHRPIFFEICKPSSFNCTSGTLVTDYQCTNPNLSEKLRSTISTSFPSGHAALAAYFSTFVIWLLQRRFQQRHVKVKFVVPTIQGLLVLWAFYCSISRITDNLHHPKDVLFGFIFGFGFAIFNVISRWNWSLVVIWYI